MKMLRTCGLLACILGSALSFGQASSVLPRDGRGGGFLDGGIRGEYFSSPAATTPSLVRRDVRIDFDWGTSSKPGGTLSLPAANVGVDNYVVRWSGRIVPQFSQTYTFFAKADDSFSLEIRRPGETSFVPLFNLTGPTPQEASVSFAMVKGEQYEVRGVYREVSGPAFVSLSWSAPGFAKEVIGPVAQASINMNTYFPNIWASASDAGRNGWEGLSQWDPGSGGVDSPPPAMDSLGYPMGPNFGLIFHEIFGDRINPMMKGRLKLSFFGRAEVLSTFGNVRFANGSNQVNGADYYNAASNKTVVDLEGFDNGWNVAMLKWAGARRTGGAGAAPGITGLKIMCPTTVGGASTFSVGTIFHPKAMEAFARFTAFRINMNTNNREVNWADRTRPQFFAQGGGKSNVCPVYGAGSSDPSFWTINSGMSWEHQIMFCNEAGKDLYINLPVLSTDDYMRKVANLVRYGSDGREPYTSPQANPVYPPLNSNLKVYVELGNELWNWGSPRDYPGYHVWLPAIKSELSSNHPNARMYNYDGRSTAIDANGWPVEYFTFFHRRTLVRTLQLSEIFRTVFGDSAMMTKVRPLFFGWYNNVFGVQELSYSFAENYFYNLGGSFVPNSNWNKGPQPMSYYIFGGGGGAHYYGSGNRDGFTQILTQGGFESPTVPEGFSTSPAGGPWTFTGNAGLARRGASENIPTAFSGAQVAWMSKSPSGQGIVRLSVPFAGTSAGTYGLAFRATAYLRPGATQADRAAFRVFVNGQDVTASDGGMVDELGNWSQVGYIPEGWNASSPWVSKQGWFSMDLHYFTKTFAATPGAPLVIEFRNTSPYNGAVTFLDDIRITSADAIFAGGVPGSGQAFGQVTNGTYDFELFGQSNWAQAYGLAYTTYEGGWSLGGDNGGSFVQNFAKYFDDRAIKANEDSMDSFHRAGGFLPTFGTYDQWPSFSSQYYLNGMLDSGSYPLAKGIDRSLQKLPMRPENGFSIPGTLTPASATLALPTTGSGAATPTARGQWVGWNILVPVRGEYTFKATTTSAGRLNLLVNGTKLGSFAGGVRAWKTVLPAGLNNVRIVCEEPGYTISQLQVYVDGLTARPTITTLTDAPSSVTVGWTAVAGASGYVLRFGTDPARLNQWRETGTSLSTTLTGLQHGTTYFVDVVATFPTGWGSPSAPRSFTFLVDGIQGPLLSWDFTGVPRGANSLVPAQAGLRLSPTNLVRSANYVDTAYYWPNALNVYPVGDVWAQNPAQCVSMNQYIEFSVAPRAGSLISLDALRLWASSQTPPPNVGVAAWWSIGGGPFSAPVEVGRLGGAMQNRLTLNMSGIASLQNLNKRIVIRLAFFGPGQWNYSFFGHNDDSPLNRRPVGEQMDLELIGRMSRVP